MRDYQLKTIRRYNNIATLSNETLAEHMYFTSLMIIRSQALLDINDQEYVQLLEYSLVHDVPELITGDFPHDLKLREPRFKELLEPIEDQVFFEEFSAPKGYYDKIKPLFKMYDLLQVVQFCNHELLLGSNNQEIKEIREHADELAHKYFRQCKREGQIIPHVTFTKLKDEVLYARKEKEN